METSEKKGGRVALPELSTFLKAGVQFGHETKRWNPKMKKYIFATKNNIHVIDVAKTLPMLEKALAFLTDAARRGSILYVGTKRQAADIVAEEAQRAGAYFVNNRWPGGLLTNFSIISKSLKRLRDLERGFEEGVHGRTKYEVSRMKVEWNKLNRLYGGIKNISKYPTAVVIVDPRYEVGAVVEAKKIGVPVVAIVDSNCDPDEIDYVVPGNDDALSSVSLLVKLFTDAVLSGNGGQGVRHEFKDYSKAEVKLIKEERKKVEEIKSNNGEKVSKIRVRAGASDEVETVEKEEVKVEKKPSTKAPKPAEKKQPKKKPVNKKKETPKVEVSARTQKSLEGAKLSLAKAKKMSDEELLEVKGIGQKGIEEIRKA